MVVLAGWFLQVGNAYGVRDVRAHVTDREVVPLHVQEKSDGMKNEGLNGDGEAMRGWERWSVNQ